MSVPPYVTYVQNLSDEDLVDIVKELMTAKIIGRPEGCSKFSDCVAAVRDFFKNVNGFTDKDMAYIDGYAMAETTVRDEVFKRFIEIHDTQSTPLTLEQLKAMDRKPVWAKHKSKNIGLWGIVNLDDVYTKISFPDSFLYYIDERNYDIDYEFYAHSSVQFKEKITNADNLKIMSNEEIANVILKENFCKFCNGYQDGICVIYGVECLDNDPVHPECVKAVLKWLEQIVDQKRGM